MGEDDRYELALTRVSNWTGAMLRNGMMPIAMIGWTADDPCKPWMLCTLEGLSNESLAALLEWTAEQLRARAP